MHYLRFFVSRWLLVTTNRLRENIKGLRFIRRAMRMERNGETRETQDAVGSTTDRSNDPLQKLPTWILTGSPVWLRHTAITGITILQISSPPGLWCGCIYPVANDPIVIVETFLFINAERSCYHHIGRNCISYCVPLDMSGWFYW